MAAIIVSGHGHFASGITSALELIMGKPQQYTAIDFPFGSSVVELEQQFDQAIARYPGQDIIIFTDLFSGSPFNIAMKKAVQDPRIHLFYGVNLGMLMETCSRLPYHSDIAEILDGIPDTGRQAMGEFHPEDLAPSTEDEAEGEEL